LGPPSSAILMALASSKLSASSRVTESGSLALGTDALISPSVT
jgi:hypothetical protein